MLSTTRQSLLWNMKKTNHRDDAWKIFLERYGDVIILWCKRRGLQQADADDLTQGVLLKLFQRLPSYEPTKGSFRAWLKTVVHNALTDLYRRNQRRPREHCGVDASRHISPEAVEELSAAIELRGRTTAADVFRRVRARVKEPSWLAFYATMVEQRRAADVAKELGLQVGSVYKNTARIKKMVAEEYSNVRGPTDATSLSE